MAKRRSSIAGSERHLRAGERWIGPANPNQQFTATVLIRRPPDSKDLDQELLSGNYEPLSREEAEAKLSATPDDMKVVSDFLKEHGLDILDADRAKRRIRVRGTAAQMDSAFSIELGCADLPDGKRVETYQGILSVPIQLSGIVTAVLGLDTRPVAAPR